MSLCSIMIQHAESQLDRHIDGDDYVQLSFGNLTINGIADQSRRSQQIDEESAGLRSLKTLTAVVKVSDLGEYLDTYNIGDRVQLLRVGATQPESFDLESITIAADNATAELELVQ